MMILRGRVAVRVVACVVGLSLVCQPVMGRGAVLRIWPQRMSAEAGKYVLLPPQTSLTDGDAVPLYHKAAQMLPDKKSDEQVQQYLKMPVVLSRTDQVEQVLKRYRESSKCMTQAVKCRDCRWPAATKKKMHSAMKSL